MLSDPHGWGYAALRIIISGFYSTSISPAINDTSFYDPSCHDVLRKQLKNDIGLYFSSPRSSLKQCHFDICAENIMGVEILAKITTA